jgi:hypothetical protein
MDQKYISLILGIAGLFTTLIATGLGFYFTAKAQSSPLRQALFSRQLDLVSRILVTQSRIRTFAAILAGEDVTFKDRARADIGESVKMFAEIEAEGAALLPTELWIELKHLTEKVVALLCDYDKTQKIEGGELSRIVAMSAKVALICRAVIGVDELTEESLTLFSSKKAYEDLTEIDYGHFEQL